MKDLKKVSIALDDILIQFFTTLDDLYGVQNSLDSVMASGYLHMSKVKAIFFSLY